MNLSKPIFLLFLLAFNCYSVKSQSTIAGAEISYTCTSTPGVVALTLVVYRSCDGGNTTPLCPGTCGAPCTQTITLKGVDSGFTTTSFANIIMSLILVRDVQTNSDCPTAKNTCNNMNCVTPGTYSPGIERYEFAGFANIGPTSGIPFACCNIRFAWESCCRNEQLATLSNPGNTTFYTDAIVNRCFTTSPCNSSPKIENELLAVACSGQNIQFNNGLIDPDVDSLSFEFTPALSAFNTPVKYMEPWNAQTPMPYSGASNSEFPGGIRCNPQTGDISFSPPDTFKQNFTGVLAIACKQWKVINGKRQIIGITRRDFDMTLLNNCPPNDPPRIVTSPPDNLNPNAPKTKWEICSGQKICFTVGAFDTNFIPPTISDTSYLAWNRSIANLGATFSPTYNPSKRRLNGPREDTWQFCWTPHDSVVKSSPYYFTITAKDNRCPNPGKETRSFSIKVSQGYKLNDPVSILTADSGCGVFGIMVNHQNPLSSTFKRLIDVANLPEDPGFNGGYVSYPYSTTLTHAFDKEGVYTIRYTAYDTVNAQNGCSPYLSIFKTINNSYINTTKEIIVTEPTNCSNTNDGRITIKITDGVSPFLFSVNNSPFNTDTVFSNLPSGSHIVRIKNNEGCVKIIKDVMVTSNPRVLKGGLLYSDKMTFYTDDTVKYWVFPEDFSTTSIKWTITNGTALSAPGTDNITVKWKRGLGAIKVIGSNKGCFDTITQTVSVTNVGVAEESATLGLDVFPNPTQNTLTISLKRVPEQTQLCLYDLQGRTLIQQEAKIVQQLHLRELPKGVYILRIGNDYRKVFKE